MRNLHINLSQNEYDIIIEENILFNICSHIKKIYKNKKIYIITDDKVASLYLESVKKSLEKDFIVDSVVFKNGEESKNIDVYAEIVKSLLAKNIRRQELLLALGGGVVGDITGFVAATLYRGLPYVGVPTTLLSQMDSSIGGKTGIDFANRKNILGCFKQPSLVLIDPLFLNTLDKKEFNNGMGELIKHAILGNKDLFESLKKGCKIDENIIYESLSVKKRVVELDEFDLNERMLLNLGHTFGHAIELELNLKHGEAVALGILMVIKFGIDLGITNPKCYDLVKNVLDLYDLPSYEINYKKYLSKTVEDKKNLAGSLRFVLLNDIASPIIYPILEENIKEFL